MRRYIAHQARFLHLYVWTSCVMIFAEGSPSNDRIPDSMPFEIAALVEPLSVAYWAIRRSKLVPGSPVLVAGAGPIGLAVALNARAAGAHPIVITDLEQQRLDQAASMGFKNTVRIGSDWDRQKTSRQSKRRLGRLACPRLVSSARYDEGAEITALMPCAAHLPIVGRL
jgi:L-iditol 2-dehydrogenase